MSRRDYLVLALVMTLYILIVVYIFRPFSAPARDYCYRPIAGEMYYTTSGQQPCPRDNTAGPNYCPAP